MSEYYDQRGAEEWSVHTESGDGRRESESDDEQTYVAVRFPVLFQAALEGDVTTLAYLLERGADPDQRLTRAMLEENIPDLDGDMTFPVEGWTALHFAASAGQLEAAMVLAERGADMQAVTPQALTAADVALYSAALERQNFPAGTSRYSVSCAIASRCEAFAEAFTPTASGRH